MTGGLIWGRHTANAWRDEPLVKQQTHRLPHAIGSWCRSLAPVWRCPPVDVCSSRGGEGVEVMAVRLSISTAWLAARSCVPVTCPQHTLFRVSLATEKGAAQWDMKDTTPDSILMAELFFNLDTGEARKRDFAPGITAEFPKVPAHMQGDLTAALDLAPAACMQLHTAAPAVQRQEVPVGSMARLGGSGSTSSASLLLV